MNLSAPMTLLEEMDSIFPIMPWSKKTKRQVDILRRAGFKPSGIRPERVEANEFLLAELKRLSPQ